MSDRVNRLSPLAAFVAALALVSVTLLVGASDLMPAVFGSVQAQGLQAAASPSSPQAATLIGHVKWEDWPPGEVQPDPLQVQPFTITLRSSSISVNYPFMYTDEYGFFTITTDLPEGVYCYRLKGHPPDPVNDPGPSWLASIGSVTITNGLTTRLELGFQKGGDADNSNLATGTLVDVVDFNIFKNTFGCAPGNCDLRANFSQESAETPEVVDVSDFNTMKRNFGVQCAGGPIPTCICPF